MFFGKCSQSCVSDMMSCLLIIPADRMVDVLRILCIFQLSTCVLWPSRLLHRSWSLQSLRRHSKALHLYQHRVADDSSAHIAHTCTRHQQLCELVGEALAAARTRPRPSIRITVVCDLLPPHATQVMYTGSNHGEGEPSADDERSQRFVSMTPV